MEKIKVWGLSGKAGSGKDYIYTNYFKPMRFHNFALAWHMKISVIGRGLASYDDAFTHKPEHVRKIIQLEGTERGRLKYGENIWTDTAKAWMRLYNECWGITKFVITDVRFPNEAEFVKSMGGIVIRVDAPIRVSKNNLTPEARLHLSEIALDHYTDFDYVINNDYNDAYGQVMQIFDEQGIE